MEIQVEGRNLNLRKSWHERIQEERERLTRHHPGLVHNLRITIEETAGHKTGGYELRVVASVPNDTVVVKRKGEAVPPLLVDAFDTLGLQLKELQRKRRQTVKSAEVSPTKGTFGVVRAVYPEESYGFLVTPDGREVYFHANALKDLTIEEVGVGDEVRFAETDGDKGPQATWVRKAA